MYSLNSSPSVTAHCIYRFSLLLLADWNICTAGDEHQQDDERTNFYPHDLNARKPMKKQSTDEFTHRR